MNSTGHFNFTANELKEKVRGAFYTIKRKIPTDILIRTWLKIIHTYIQLWSMVMKCGAPKLIKISQNVRNTHWKSCMQSCVKSSMESTGTQSAMHAGQNSANIQSLSTFKNKPSNSTNISNPVTPTHISTKLYSARSRTRTRREYRVKQLRAAHGAQAVFTLHTGNSGDRYILYTTLWQIFKYQSIILPKNHIISRICSTIRWGETQVPIGWRMGGSILAAKYEAACHSLRDSQRHPTSWTDLWVLV